MTSVLALRRSRLVLILLVAFACLLFARAAAFGQTMPLQFEINRGQHAPAVRYAARGPGYGLFLTAAETVLVARGAAVRMSFPGANGAPIVSGIDALPDTANYFRGRNPDAWQAKIPTFARVAYREIYPGVDLVFYGNPRQIEYDFLVSPSGDPARILLRFDGVDDVGINADGDLVLRAGEVEFRQLRPVVYQHGHGAGPRETIEGRYVLRDAGAREVGFALGPYDRTRPLVIDPVLAFSSYLGGTGTDIGERIAVDLFGNSYLTGSTTSPDFPVTNGGSPTSALEDIFVTKGIAMAMAWCTRRISAAANRTAARPSPSTCAATPRIARSAAAPARRPRDGRS